jgi:hypothetical protein
MQDRILANYLTTYRRRSGLSLDPAKQSYYLLHQDDVFSNFSNDAFSAQRAFSVSLDATEKA